MMPERSFRRAVLTGGAGFLGSHLCDRLVAAGTEVTCVDNFVTGKQRNLAGLLSHPLFDMQDCDVTDPLRVPGDVDLVLHLASPASPKDYQRIPIETMLTGSQGCMRALELAEAKEARFVLASTSEVYGNPQQHPQQESYWGNVNPVGPRAVYDEAKRYAEALTFAYRRQRGVDTGIARIFNTYGPRMDPADGRMVPSFLTSAMRNEPLRVTGTGRQTRSLCYVSDTVEGLLALARSQCEGPINIGNPGEKSVLHIAETIRELVGGHARIEHIEAMTDDPQRRCPDITLARNLLRWEPTVALREGLLRTIEWFCLGRADSDGGRLAPLVDRNPGFSARDV